MKVLQTLLIVGIVGAGGVLAYMIVSKRKQTGGSPAVSTSVNRAAYVGTGSSGEPSGTNKYDAILGIGSVVGNVISSGIDKGIFSSDDGDSKAIRSADDAGIAAPGQTLIFN